MANNTYIGGEIKLIRGLSDLFAIDSNIIRYTKTNDHQEISIQEIINTIIDDISGKANLNHKHEISNINGLENTISNFESRIEALKNTINNFESRIEALENSKIYEVNVTLNYLTCDELTSIKTLPISGGTFTIKANDGYSLPSSLTVTNADHTWDSSEGVLTISNVIGKVTILASGVENKPTSIKIYNEDGTSELNTTQTIIGTNQTIKIRVKVESNKTLLPNKSQFKVTTIPSSITVKNGATLVDTDTVLNTDTVLTISGVSQEAVNLVVTATANDSLIDSLSVNIVDGSTTAVSVKNSSNGTSSSLEASGGEVRLTATVESTKFDTGEITWTRTGGSFKNNETTGDSVTFIAPANDSETDDATYTITATCDGQYANYIVTVAHKTASINYYWYVGQTNPTSMTSIDPIVKDNTSPGWRLIGTSIPAYTANNVLWDGQKNEIVFDNYNDVTAYLALPNNTIKLRDGLGNDVTSELLSLGTKNINGVNYYIYQNKLGSSNYMQYSLDLVLF